MSAPYIFAIEIQICTADLHITARMVACESVSTDPIFKLEQLMYITYNIYAHKCLKDQLDIQINTLFEDSTSLKLIFVLHIFLSWYDYL